VVLLLCAALTQPLSEDAQHRLSLTTPPQHGGKPVSLMLLGASGVTGTAVATGGGDRDDHLGAVSLTTRRIGYSYDRGIIVRAFNWADVGGTVHNGVFAFHGGTHFELAGGYRFHLSDTSGPFVRGGLDGMIGGDPLVYQSLLELPQVELGYQYLAGSTLFEVAGRSGFSILGRSNTGYPLVSRHLDEVPDVGAMITARIAPIFLVAEWSHFLARDNGWRPDAPPVDWVTVSVCGIVKRIAICTDVRAVEEDVYVSHELLASHSTQVGITLGPASRF
jgi:hypothetical protein